MKTKKIKGPYRQRVEKIYSEKLLKKAEKQPVTMVEYSIKMTIPTGNYANIQPEIKVTAATPEDAHEYIAPHMNKLWKEYFMVNERVVNVVETKKPDTVPSANTTTTQAEQPAVTQKSEPVVQPPASNVAVIKATQAIESCTSLDALELIRNQVELSVKLSKEEKPALRDKIIEKFNELNADAFIKKNNG